MSVPPYQAKLRRGSGPSMYQGYSITIKYPLAKELGWKEGDALQVDSSEGRLVISKVASPAA